MAWRFYVGGGGSKVTAKWAGQLGRALEVDVGAGKLTRESGMWGEAVKGKGIEESVCAC